MRILHFDGAGRPIHQFDSREAWIDRVARLESGATIHRIRIGARGRVGFHQAAQAQLFLVVSGSGWVRGESVEHVPIEVGQAAFWEKGEFHESGSEAGMTALVIEGEGLEPAA